MSSTSRDMARPEARKVARPYRDPGFFLIFRRAVQRRSSEQVARVPVARNPVVHMWAARRSVPGRGSSPRASVAEREGCSIIA